MYTKIFFSLVFVNDKFFTDCLTFQSVCDLYFVKVVRSFLRVIFTSWILVNTPHPVEHCCYVALRSSILFPGPLLSCFNFPRTF